MRRWAWAALASSLLAGPAAAEAWWMGPANPAGVTFIDFDRVTTNAQGLRVAIEYVMIPRETMIDGKPVAVIIAHQAYDCEAGTTRFLGGNATTDKADIVVRIPPDPAAQPRDPKTDGWKVMKLVCAGSDAERSRFGRFVGEANFDSLLAQWRPPPRTRPSRP